MKNDLVIGGVVLVVIAIGLYFLLREPGTDSVPAEPAGVISAPVTDTAPPADPMPAEELSMPATGTAPPPAAPALPPLAESDGLVRETLAQSALPQTWLAKEDLVRRLAVVMDNARKGEYPRQQLAFLAPAGKFEVIREGDRLLVDPISYERFDGYVDTLESVDPVQLAGWVSTFEPLISEALGELGNPGAVDDQLVAAIDLLLAVPEPGAEVELVQPKVFYEYADPALEGLQPLQKQLLRMGPSNVRRLKAYLTRLRAELVK